MENANSTTSNTTMPILNPDTPLAFLTPEQAYQTTVSTYVLVASLGVSLCLDIVTQKSQILRQVLLWDCLDNISEDFSIIFRSRFTLTTAAFIGSRYVRCHSLFPWYFTLMSIQTWVIGVCNWGWHFCKWVSKCKLFYSYWGLTQYISRADRKLRPLRDYRRCFLPYLTLVQRPSFLFPPARHL